MAAVTVPRKAQSPAGPEADTGRAGGDQQLVLGASYGPEKLQAASPASQKAMTPGQHPRRQHKRGGGFLCCFTPAVVPHGDDEPTGAATAAAPQPAVIDIQAVGGPTSPTGKACLPAVTATAAGDLSRTSSEDDVFEEFFDARSQASSFDLGGVPAYQAEVLLSDFVQEGNQQPDQHSKQQPLKQQQLLGAAAAQQEQQQQQQEQQQAAEQPHWVPNPPLMFADREMEFAPVPAKTGFAGDWELVKERTSPHPQPIDVMIGAGAIVRRIHASLPGIYMEEDDGIFKVMGRPAFIPKGIPSVHTELYDKTHKEKISWWPRRDVVMGKAVGEVFYTADGTLILRSETFPMFSKNPDYVVEDYMHLEEDGTVLVDRMCCYCTRTGRSATQMQVVRKIAEQPAKK